MSRKPRSNSGVLTRRFGFSSFPPSVFFGLALAAWLFVLCTPVVAEHPPLQEKVHSIEYEGKVYTYGYEGILGPHDISGVWDVVYEKQLTCDMKQKYYRNPNPEGKIQEAVLAGHAKIGVTTILYKYEGIIYAFKWDHHPFKGCYRYFDISHSLIQESWQRIFNKVFGESAKT